MHSRRNSGGSKRAAAIAVGAAILATTLALTGAVSAQDGQSGPCSGATVVVFGDALFGTEDGGNRLLSSGPTAREYPLGAAIAPGTYTVTAFSYDGYSTREAIPAQPDERWFAELIASDGRVVATTAATGDIEDGVVEASWTGSLGEVVLTSGADTVRVVHAAPGSPNVNSVRAVCIGLDPVADEPTIEPSSVSVNFEADAAWPVILDCGGNRIDSATGRTVELRIGQLEPTAQCGISYTDDLDSCDVAVTANAASTEFIDTELIVTVPDEGGADIVVDITCDSARIKPPTDDSSTDEPEVTVTPTTIVPEVRTVTEVATPIDSNPAFTG